MRYLYIGLICGFILGFLPFFKPVGGVAIYPEWHGKIDLIKNIQKASNPLISKIQLPPVKTTEKIFTLSGNGEILTEMNMDHQLVSFSKNGKYIIKYDKIGTNIEFLNIHGERFWKSISMEYPYISFNGKIILLMNGDHSAIRIVDFNGNEIGSKKINGRFCTVISFSKFSDFAGIGFLDGSFFIINYNGEIIYKGIASENFLIKGIAISSNGQYIAIHHGGKEGDFIRLVNLNLKKFFITPLKHIHISKTSLKVLNDGRISVIDYNRILLIGNRGKITKIIETPTKRPGTSTIDYANGIFIASYTKTTGNAHFIIYREDGTPLFAKNFSSEPFLISFMNDSVIFLRGSESLFCYYYTHQYNL